LGKIGGEIAFRLHHTSTIPTNIRLCFPSLDENTRRKFIRNYYHNLGQTLFNLGLAWTAPEKKIRKWVSIKGNEHYQQAVDSGKGIILLAPHFIGLELGWARLSLEWPLSHMYRKPRNPFLHQFLQYFRTRHGGIAIERYANLKPLIKSIREKTGFYYLPDQDPDHAGKDYIFAPFFGIPTATYTALGRLAAIGNACVIPCVTHQLANGKGYEVVLKAPLVNFPSGDPEQDTIRMNQEIEKLVLEYPEQYFWSYRRFKTRPGNEPPVY